MRLQSWFKSASLEAAMALAAQSVSRRHALRMKRAGKSRFPNRYASEGLEQRILLSTAPPLVTTGPVTTISSTSASLTATVNPQGSTTTVGVQYSTDPSFTPTVQSVIAAGFGSPQGVAVDAAGDAFVADASENTVTEIPASGTAKTIGSGFNTPSAVAVDSSGDVFVADFGSGSIKEILPNNTVKTVGSGFGGPLGVAVDSSGDVFVGDYINSAVEEILPNNTVKTLGSGFNNPAGVAVDAAGNVFVADYNNYAVKEILPSGTVNTIASNVDLPLGVGVNAFGDVFVGAYGDASVTEILPNGSTVALGSGLGHTAGISVDPAGQVYVASLDGFVGKLAAPSASITLNGSSTSTVPFTFSNLTAGTVYYDRAFATGPGGTVVGATSVFPSPSVVTEPVSAASSTGATLNATINPEGLSTTASFQYSTDPSFTPTVQTTIATGFDYAFGTAVDAAGDVFVADIDTNTISEILPSGAVETIGSGFSAPDGVAVDAAGDVFVADTGNDAVKEVFPDGTIKTIGSGFSHPDGVAVDAAGDVLVADTYNQAVKEVLPDGAIDTIATGFDTPVGVAVDSAGDVFVTDNAAQQLDEVLPDGAIVTIATQFGSPVGVAVNEFGDLFVEDSYASTVDEFQPNGTKLNLGSNFVGAIGLAVDAAGDVFVATGGSGTIVKLTPPTVAATSSPLTGSTATAVSASLTGLTPGVPYYERAVATGPGGTVVGATGSFPGPTVVTEPVNSIVSSSATLDATVNANGLSTTASFQYSTDPSFTPTVQTTIASGFNNASTVAVDAAGDVFVADAGASTINEILPSGTVITIGSGFSHPEGVAVDAAGDVFVADTRNNAVKEIFPDGAMTTIGSGFSHPGGVAVDAAGDVFVADTYNEAVKEVLPNGTIDTIGTGFAAPVGVALDSAGDVFVTDTALNTLKEILPNGTIVPISPLFLSAFGVAVNAFGDVFVGDQDTSTIDEFQPNGTELTLGSNFVDPSGVAMDAAGDLFVATGTSGTVVKLSPPTVAATPSTISGSTPTAVSATLTGLAPGTPYYERVITTGPGGTVAGPTTPFITGPALTNTAFTINSKSLAATPVGNVGAIGSPGAPLSYILSSLTGTTVAAFKINSSGEITIGTVSALPAIKTGSTSATATFEVIATDEVTHLFTGKVVTVTLQTGLAMTPIFSTTQAAFAHFPAAANAKGVTIGTVAAKIAYTGQVIKYSLSGTNASLFSISSTGVITTKMQLVSGSSYSFDVVATDGTSTSTSSVAVTFIVPATGTGPIITGLTDTPIGTLDVAAAYPYATVAIADPNLTARETVTVSLDAATKGTLADSAAYLASSAGTVHFSAVSGKAGTYSAAGTAAQVSAALDALAYKPAAYQVAPGSTYTATLAISVSDVVIKTATTNSTTQVIVTQASDIAPTLAGLASKTTTVVGEVKPFLGVTVTDPEAANFTFGTRVSQTETVTITESSTASGSLSGELIAGTTAGTYSIIGTPAVVNAALATVLFQPAAGCVPSGSPKTETLAISVSDGTLAASGSTDIDISGLYAITPTMVSTTLIASIAKGAAVVNLAGSDADPLTYTLVTGTGSTNNSSFKVASNQLIAAATLTARTYLVLVKATDANGDSVTQGLKIVVGKSSSSVTLSGTATIHVA